MTYVLPRVQIEQEFTSVPTFSSRPLPALIIGPNYKLYRYSNASERLDSLLTASYVTGSDNAYNFPYQPANSVVDSSFTKVYFDSVVAQYFPNAALGSASAVVTATAGYTNRVTSSLVLKTSAYSNRNAQFSNRDVAVGDEIYLHGASSGTLRTKITGLHASTIDPTYGTVTPGGSNVALDTLPVTVSSPTAFTGTSDITYILTVTRGGKFLTEAGETTATCAQITVTSTGTDSSPVQNISENVAFNVGTKGLTMKWATAAGDKDLELGNTWTIAVTAAKVGDVNQIEVADVLPTFSGAIDMTLYLKQNDVNIPQVRSAAGGTFNWTTTSTQITLIGNAATTDSKLVSSGIPVDLPIYSAKAYVEYRALLGSAAAAIGSLSNPNDVADTLGPVTPDNALAEGVYDALLNSAGVPVYYIGVASDDADGYAAALDKAKQTDAIYSIVPLTFDLAVKDLVVSHVNAMSTAIAAKWRIAWFSAPMLQNTLLYDMQSNNTDWLATVTGSPAKLVTMAGATFIDSGVRAGDTYLTSFTTNALGVVSHVEYEIEEVLTQTTLKLKTAVPVAIAIAVKGQIRRNYTNAEQINALISSGSSYNSRRIRTVFPDTVKTAGVEKNGYFVAAALAGLRSGVAPHQSLTNIELLGFDDFTKSVHTFTYDQLNTLAGQGYWIVTQPITGGTAYTRHQLTTDGIENSGNLSFSEDSITTNVDSISYALQSRMAPFIGIYNINPTNVLLVRDAINTELRFRATGTWVPRAGNQLNGFTIKNISQNALFKDRIDVEIELEVPYPMNVISITLIV